MFLTPAWDDSLTEDALNEMHEAILQRTAEDPVAMHRFASQADVVFVLLANVLEGTMPEGISESGTYKLVLKTLEEGIDSSVTFCRWNAEGEDRDDGKTQLVCSALAFKHLLETPLDAECLKAAHGKLMRMSFGDDGHDVVAGEYRQCGAHNGHGFQYAHHEEIDGQVDRALAKFAQEVADRHTQIQAIARLVHTLLCIHPFENGNGRLCRLIAGAQVKRLGLAPFAVALSSGRSKCRKHYLNALRYADRTDRNVGHVSTLLLYSIHSKWANFDLLRSF